MKTAVVIARTLLGIIFVVFGLNGFLQFLPQPEMPQAAIAFFGGLAASGFMLPTLFATQLVGGALLLLSSTSSWRRRVCPLPSSSRRSQCSLLGPIVRRTAPCSQRRRPRAH
jgi:hypothetical protein